MSTVVKRTYHAFGMECLQFLSVLRIRIRWIRKILASWIQIFKNIRIHGFRSNIEQKLKKIVSSQNQNVNFWKKRDFKISWFLNGSSSFSIKISETNKTQNLKILLLLEKFSKLSDPFFSNADSGSGNGSASRPASKLNGS